MTDEQIPEFITMLRAISELAARSENLGTSKLHYEAAALIESLRAELTRREELQCAAPDVASCVKQWEADHQKTALDRHGLAAEFPYGCDAIDHVAEALVASRAEIAKRNEVLLHGIHYGPETGYKIDMRLGGEPATLFLYTLVEFFYANGGKNYVTITATTAPAKDNVPPAHLEITIRNCDGVLTPAEEIARLKALLATHRPSEVEPGPSGLPANY